MGLAQEGTALIHPIDTERLKGENVTSYLSEEHLFGVGFCFVF